MKRLDFSCASPASIAICSSLDHRSNIVNHAHKSINHHHKYSHLPGSKGIDNIVRPCSSISHLPINPKPQYENYHKKSPKKSTTPVTTRRKSSREISNDIQKSPSSGSSRYLLTNHAHSDSSSVDNFLSTSTPDRHASSMALVPLDHQSGMPIRTQIKTSSHYPPALRSSSSARNHHDQVVILRVSLHCKGCEAKVRKHITRMEGVRSFSIEFETKKVTVRGDVTPLGVLASVSKVKNAQLWSPSSSRWSA